MLLSSQTHNAASRFGDEKAVRLLAAAGYDAIDFSMFENYNAKYLFADSYKEYALRLRDVADECGVVFNQAHAPFPSYRENDEKYNTDVYPKLKKSIEIAGVLGVKYIVIHPFVATGDKKKANIDFFRSLEPVAAKADVKIAIENMWAWDSRRACIIPKVCSVPDELCEYADELGTENFGVCLDIGHCGLVGEDEAGFIKKLGKRLTCLHVHDTNYRKDLHTLPYMGEIDYESVCNALKEIGYAGDITLEADNFLLRIPDEIFEAALKFMEKTGRYLVSRCR